MLMDLIEERHSIRKYRSADQQATELGIASCIISRGAETFCSEEGQRLLKEWEIPANYSCQGFVILGYIEGEQPHRKPRKPGRIKIIEAVTESVTESVIEEGVEPATEQQ
jgi:nitroreductase